MLVTFKCKDYANITMFGTVAQQLFTMMGHSGTVPGAILAKDVPAVLARLQETIEKAKKTPPAKAYGEDAQDDFNDQPVSLASRALPLLELLTFAAKEKNDVMWE